MISNPYAQYKEQALSTLGPGEILVKLYDELIKQMRLASLAIEKMDYAAVSETLTKSQTIIATLEASLDSSFEISANLRDMYIFLAQQLLSANLKKDAKVIDECIPLVRDLRDSFDQADKINRSIQAGVRENIG